MELLVMCLRPWSALCGEQLLEWFWLVDTEKEADQPGCAGTFCGTTGEVLSEMTSSLTQQVRPKRCVTEHP